MKEIPILFKGSMVRAILDGRKTQTRRVIKPQPEYVGRINGVNYDWVWKERCYSDDGIKNIFPVACSPYLSGDFLWVKETWGRIYRGHVYSDDIIFREDRTVSKELIHHWNSPLHLKKADARLWLEVVNVRAEKVKEISRQDAIAEGIEVPEWVKRESMARRSEYDAPIEWTYEEGFRDLWDSINKDKYPWESNPWVWVIEFKRGKTK